MMNVLVTNALLAATILFGGENRDRTGIQWVLPFRATLAKATAEHRLLLIKPIAFGTDKAGGW
jgi:hypothetical protein